MEERLSPGQERLRRLESRIEMVRERIVRAGGDPERVRVIAVTKGHDLEAVRLALETGLVDLGENYADDLVRKASALESDVPFRWHYLGRVQRNKVPRLVEWVTLWQSVDRLEAGAAIARRMPGAAVLVQVNLDSFGPPVQVPGVRGGCAPDELEELVHGLRSFGLAVEGLMAVGPHGFPEESRRGFSWLAARRDELGLAELSMGMTDDLEVAVSEGSTMVRIGRALFGDRPDSG